MHQNIDDIMLEAKAKLFMTCKTMYDTTLKLEQKVWQVETQ